MWFLDETTIVSSTWRKHNSWNQERTTSKAIFRLFFCLLACRLTLCPDKNWNIFSFEWNFKRDGVKETTCSFFFAIQNFICQKSSNLASEGRFQYFYIKFLNEGVRGAACERTGWGPRPAPRVTNTGDCSQYYETLPRTSDLRNLWLRTQQLVAFPPNFKIVFD